MNQTLLFVVNPVSGKAKARSVLMDILSVFSTHGFMPTVHITRQQGDACRVVAEHAKSFDRIVCCGGDGTLNEVISGMLMSGVNKPIGYIPLGSTNDFAAGLKLPTVPTEAAERAVTGTAHPIDVGQFRDRYFSYIASFGAFTAASYSATQSAKNLLGHTAYVLEGVKDIVNIRPMCVWLQADGRTYNGPYVFGAISNSLSVGGLVKLDPRLVDVQDGLFEVTLVRQPQSLADLNRILTAVSTGDFTDNPMFEFFKASDITVRCREPFAWSLDGEYAHGDEEIRIRNKKQAISIII